MKILEHIRRTGELKRDYQQVFSTPEGQRVLKHLLQVSGVTRFRFSKDADEIRWNEAQRHFALSIFNQVHGSTTKLPDYLEEQIRAQEEENK